MEAGNGHQNGGYATGGKGAATGDSAGLPGSISNQYLARMTQYYTEGNEVRESVKIWRTILDCLIPEHRCLEHMIVHGCLGEAIRNFSMLSIC